MVWNRSIWCRLQSGTNAGLLPAGHQVTRDPDNVILQGRNLQGTISRRVKVHLAIGFRDPDGHAEGVRSAVIHIVDFQSPGAAALVERQAVDGGDKII